MVLYIPPERSYSQPFEQALVGHEAFKEVTYSKYFNQLDANETPVAVRFAN